MLLIPVLLPVIVGILVKIIKIENRKVKLFLVGGVSVLTTIFTFVCIFAGASDMTLVKISDTVSFLLSLDGMGKFFSALISVVWTIVTFYSFSYMTHEENEDRFFMFLLLSFGAMLGMCFAGNLVTMYLFFEMATFMSMPLVLHSMKKEAISAALKYLFYSVGGAFMAFLAIMFVHSYTGGAGFVSGGALDLSAISNSGLFLAVIFIGIIGFGTKAGMYPMHGWLPTAHPVAPAPASALLSGIIAKAGVLAIIRLIFFSVGADYIKGTWVQYAWMTLCMVTIFMGSMMAYREKILKKRLAYSTVSQISYILLGLSFLSPESVTGSLLHVLAHASSKGVLFLVAGAIIYTYGKTSVDELEGIGKQMPITMWGFTLAALSLVGIPPFGGFVSKWQLATAAIDSGIEVFSVLAPVILLVSALLTAGYLLPITVKGFFPGENVTLERRDAPKTMYISIIILVLLAVLEGILGTAATGVLSSIAGSAF